MILAPIPSQHLHLIASSSYGRSSWFPQPKEHGDVAFVVKLTGSAFTGEVMAQRGRHVDVGRTGE
jgi:hypothetical protein